MPYIKPDKRPRIDQAVKVLAEAVAKSATNLDDEIGCLNYAITRLVLAFSVKTYPRIAAITGMLVNIKDEYTRRYTTPFEDRKIEENGDAYHPWGGL